MPRAYSVDLRERVVAAYHDGEGTYTELADRYQVGEASVSRWLGLDRRTGSLQPKKPVGRPQTLVSVEGLEFIRECLEAAPDLTMVELSAAYLEEFGVTVSRATMSRMVNSKLGFTRKKGVSARQPRAVRTSNESKRSLLNDKRR